MSDSSVSTDLKTSWSAYRRENPKVRERDAAADLGVSEAELVATGCGAGVTRLSSEWPALLQELEGLGDVMALTRNDVFVHEKVGRYRNVSIHPDHNMGQVLDEQIDLRIFFRHWHFGFAVVKETDDGPRRSLQFFDAQGTAVHKTHLREESDVDHYHALVEKYRHADQTPSLEITPAGEPDSERPDDEIDREALRQEWRALKDTHDFIFLLRNHEISRLQAFRLAGSDFAREVDTSSLRIALEAAAADQLPIMVFVGNHGCIQIHTGTVTRLKDVRAWYNVLDPGFSLHVRERQIASAWVVRKPTAEGDVHSVEFFDADGNVVCYLFGKRKEGRTELEGWREIVGRLD